MVFGRLHYLKTFQSQLETTGFKGQKKLCYDFWLKTWRDSKVRAAKDQGKKFRIKLFKRNDPLEVDSNGQTGLRLMALIGI